MTSTKLFIGALIISALALAGCPELGQITGLEGLGGYGGTAAGRDVVGEVEHVDTRARQIEVRTDDRRTAVLRYDDRTQVVYRQRNYTVDNLEAGDYIAARVQQDRDGRNYTDTITVRESVQDRGGRSGGGSGRATSRGYDQVDGRVEYIEPRRGTFELRDSRNRMLLVSLPFNAPRQVLDRFNRLREGESVLIEGRLVGNDRFELERFL
jgi:hypothetical protein